MSEENKIPVKAVGGDMSAGMIVLVDDEEVLLKLFGRIIESLGFRAITFSDPKKALTFIEKQDQNPDLVIADFVMPQMSGVELIGEIRKKWPEMPMLCISGMEGSSKLAKKAGCVNFLLKPFSREALEEKIHNALE